MQGELWGFHGDPKLRVADNEYLVIQRTLGLFQMVSVSQHMQRSGNTSAHRKRLIVAAAMVGAGTL